MEKKIKKIIINDENIKRTLKVLEDNGIEKDEFGYVLEAIGYTLLDEDLNKIIDHNLEQENSKISCVTIKTKGGR